MNKDQEPSIKYQDIGTEMINGLLKTKNPLTEKASLSHSRLHPDRNPRCFLIPDT